MSVSGERGKRDVPRRRLEELLGEMPRSWRPEVGAVLVGQAVRYDRAESTDGSCWLCVLEEPTTGDLITIFLSASELESEKPMPGEMIGIKRLPAAEKGRKKFSLIVVAREAAEGIPDLDEISPPVPPGEPPFADAPTDDVMPFSGEALSGDDNPF